MGILQARILEWVATPSSKGSSWPRDETRVSHVAGELLTVWVTRKLPSWSALNSWERAGSRSSYCHSPGILSLMSVFESGVWRAWTCCPPSSLRGACRSVLLRLFSEVKVSLLTQLMALTYVDFTVNESLTNQMACWIEWSVARGKA